MKRKLPVGLSPFKAKGEADEAKYGIGIKIV
jgi:hypothetical protein